MTRAVPVQAAQRVQGTTASRRWRLGSMWVLGGILFVALGLRFYGLADWPILQDELYTLRDSRDFDIRVSYVRPFYFFLQSLLLRVLPETLLLVRLPAFLFGVLGVWLTWELGRRRFGTAAGLVAAFLVAISPWHVFMSQFARYWSLIYVLATGLYLVLPRAIDDDRPAAFVGALVLILVGAVTHPTFAFPVIGILGAVLLVDADGRLDVHLPSRRGWLFFWAPLLVIGLAAITFLLASGTIAGLRGSRGPAAIMRLMPAIVQWAGPVLVTAASLAILLQLFGPRREDRRWGAMAALGGLTCVALLLVMSFRNRAYADYATAMLPLLFVSVGGAAQRVSERLEGLAKGFPIAISLVVAAGVLPSTVSHLTDGTRFDYRPALEHVRQAGADHVVVGWPLAVYRYYAPDLRLHPLEPRPAELARIGETTSGFWLLASHRRYGLVNDDGQGTMAAWIAAHCRRVLKSGGARLDYRTYRVELHWCGPDPVPAVRYQSASRAEDS